MSTTPRTASTSRTSTAHHPHVTPSTTQRTTAVSSETVH
jgi:hypothetical protein